MCFQFTHRTRIYCRNVSEVKAGVLCSAILYFIKVSITYSNIATRFAPIVQFMCCFCYSNILLIEDGFKKMASLDFTLPVLIDSETAKNYE